MRIRSIGGTNHIKQIAASCWRNQFSAMTVLWDMSGHMKVNKTGYNIVQVWTMGNIVSIIHSGPREYDIVLLL